jgi:hypothetical protein
MVGLCFSVLARFLLSLRFTGGGVPMAVRAMAFTALVARNGLGFFFFGTGISLTTEDTERHKENSGVFQGEASDSTEVEEMLSPILRALCALCG